MFDRALSFHERSQVGLYLRQKYGQTGYTAYNTHLATREWSFIGADPGEGLDFQGSFVYAVNARGPGGIQVGDAAFTTDAGLISSEYEIPNWTSPNYGPSTDDQNLQTVMQSIRWTWTNAAGQENLTVTLPNLVPGRTYKLQMLMADNQVDRHWAVDINGSRVVGDFQSAAMQGATNTQGSVLVHQFVATGPTMSIAFDGTAVAGGDTNPILNALTLEDLGVTGRTSIRTFTGGDPGEGLDLRGNFLYAVNVGGPGGFKAGDAAFTADTSTPGVTMNAENVIPAWLAPSYGASPDDAGLAGVMQSIRWTNTQSSVTGAFTRGEALGIDLAGLTPGQQYVLQLLFGENPGSRGFDVVIDDVLVADNFSPTSAGVSANVGVVLAHQFHASSDMLHIVLDGFPTGFGDRNPILNAFTLQIVPEPATWVLLVLGAVGAAGVARRRRRR